MTLAELEAKRLIDTTREAKVMSLTTKAIIGNDDDDDDDIGAAAGVGSWAWDSSGVCVVGRVDPDMFCKILSCISCS